MGCAATTCKNCKRRTKACNLKKAEDGKQCCTACVTAYNNEYRKTLKK